MFFYTLTNVHTFERMQVEKEVVSNMTETYIELLNVSIGLAYSSPDFDALTESSAFSDSMAEYQQAIQAQKQFEAQQRELAEQKRLEEQYAKAHPIETYLKESSEEVAKAWGKAVNYIENLPIDQLVEQYGLPEGFKALGKAEKEKILFQMGIIGAAGSLISDTAIGAVSTYNSIENAVDTATLKMAGLKPPKYMEYKMEQDKKALTDTYNLVATEEGRAQLKEGVTKMIGNITQNIKNGDSYAIGGYVFNTATLFIPGAGPAAGVAKMSTTAGKISSSVIKQGKALKAGTIVGSISKQAVRKFNQVKKAAINSTKDFSIQIANGAILTGKLLNDKVSLVTVGNVHSSGNSLKEKSSNWISNIKTLDSKLVVYKEDNKYRNSENGQYIKEELDLSKDVEIRERPEKSSKKESSVKEIIKTEENSSKRKSKMEIIRETFSTPVKVSNQDFEKLLLEIKQPSLKEYFNGLITFRKSEVNINHDKINDLLIAIQNTEFKPNVKLTEDDLNRIRETMRSIGIEDEYDAILRNDQVMKYGTYYKNRVG